MTRGWMSRRARPASHGKTDDGGFAGRVGRGDPAVPAKPDCQRRDPRAVVEKQRIDRPVLSVGTVLARRSARRPRAVLESLHVRRHADRGRTAGADVLPRPLDLAGPSAGIGVQVLVPDPRPPGLVADVPPDAELGANRLGASVAALVFGLVIQMIGFIYGGWIHQVILMSLAPGVIWGSS